MTERCALHNTPDNALLVIRLALEVTCQPNRTAPFTAPTDANPPEGSAA